MTAPKSTAIVPKVLDFWFGAVAEGAEPEPREIWFKPTPEFDREIEEILHEDHKQALAGGLDGLMQSAEGCLALVILLDQVPRNVFRGTPQAFAADEKAREVAGHALAHGFDTVLPAVQAMFLYLPFEHSEDLSDQERSVALFEALGNDYWLDYAVRHRDIVARFGRFPHRNAILGRTSTQEEAEFLKQPGSSF
jgi:uncharacterized protein (DUF924 family)